MTIADRPEAAARAHRKKPESVLILGSGPVVIASQMCCGVVSCSDGANLPCVSSPPLPAKLWHCAQLVRNSSPPTASSVLLRSRSSAVGTVGPPPSVWI